MIVFVSFLLGVIITISEPDLQVLANQVPNIPNAALIGTVALGVGIFLIIAMLRILFGISLNILLIGFYIVVFLMAMFVQMCIRDSHKEEIFPRCYPISC